MLYFIIVINLITFFTFSLDKWKAVKNRRRISEFSLLILTFIGGTIGAVLAMVIFRHKVSKTNFLLKIGLIILAQIFIVIFFNLKILNVENVL
ncbi:DUF1294 domain-containing protein [Chryseobacterium wangxinyae]|uniref:DUF1294 domain-containing protein n=1 Tax=Chryseobacterium sp. CY350 TaxID=2997336 RepID=UPI00226FD43A|nr:DUF1294 domain-containing protein [Chryseobacterium sp. CY350]MCY0978658.1 DUF1294 domain-containing protein [Chryseobacterium sp. CY350]WBZ96426.1 DUF1294 domain-containing protein [Chryseobacterium sp. CY350]